MKTNTNQLYYNRAHRQSGELIGVCGAVGSGKSSLLSAGLLSVTDDTRVCILGLNDENSGLCLVGYHIVTS